MSTAATNMGNGFTDVAVVGMAGRFPGARDPDEFWRNLRDGVESIRRLTGEELRAAGVDPLLMAKPNYVKAAATLDGVDCFDAPFFGLSPKDAAIMDPQHRHFLECAWEALEHAGYDPERFPGAIGVFAGCGMNAYMMFNLLTNPQLMQSVGLFLVRHTGNDKDFLATRVSYSFNLRGPSINVQTACSTSLVAIHLACQSLLNGECDLALAGAVTIEIPHGHGYLYEEGEILSHDGHCRSFDASSTGTVFGSGAGIVVLRLLEDALAAGDTIHAVIKGSAVNNDGSGKVGYFAPSVDGQAAAISEAISVSGVDPETITYIETHGTGTPVGDPIEITALTKAFRQFTQRTGFCAIGSVKSNIGHIDTAAGVAGVIKTIQALKHRQIPPSLHFEKPNPLIDFAASPFYVNAQLRPWPDLGAPRRAGVSSLGVGGTNVHVILEEAPQPAPSGPSRPWQLLTLAARNQDRLEEATLRLATHLRTHPEQNLADVAYTLHAGRRAFPWRRAVVCRDPVEAAQALETGNAQRVFTQLAPAAASSVVFLFPGGGAQYPNMGRDLYRDEPVYRQAIDRCLELLARSAPLDWKRLLYPVESDCEEAVRQMERPSIGLPALFITEYALAQLWTAWGIRPAAMIGHSAGVYAEACAAGVMSLEDALSLIVLRGRLFETLPEGAMLGVPLPEHEVRLMLDGDLSIAAVNGPAACVVSGPVAAIRRLEQQLAGRDVDCRNIKIAVAAHSAMVAPILEEFFNGVSRMHLYPPQVPFISDLSGGWATPQQAQDPDFWVGMLRHTVRFGDGIAELLKEPHRVFLEVGPGQTLSALTRQHPACKPSHAVLGSLRHPQERVPDSQFLAQTLGRLWTAGGAVDWEAFHHGEQRRRLPLPTYPFERQRHWIAPGKLAAVPEAQPAPAQREEPGAPLRQNDLAQWFYRPVWKRSDPPLAPPLTAGQHWLIFDNGDALSADLAARLRRQDQVVTIVTVGGRFSRRRQDHYTLRPGEPDDYRALVSSLVAGNRMPRFLLHLWACADSPVSPLAALDAALDRHFYSLLFLAQALGAEGWSEPLDIAVVSTGLQAVNGECRSPDKAVMLGPVRVLPREFSDIRCRSVDLLRAQKSEAAQVLSEFATPPAVAAWRDGQRWIESWERTALPRTTPSAWPRPQGVYLLTGGLGGIALVLSEFLARAAQAKLVLVSRSALPPRAEWRERLAKGHPEDPTCRRIRAVEALEAAGSEVMVVQADVGDLDQMRRVVELARHRFGAIHGVFHAAGLLHDRPALLKSREEAAAVLAPKVRGTLVLDEIFRHQPLDCFVLFSSTSSLLGLPGQIDYSAANAFLDAFAQSRPGTLAVNWGVWNEVGMTARLSQGHGVPTGHPLLGRRTAETPNEIVYEARYDPAALWALDEHRLRTGVAVLPGAAYVESARACLGRFPVEIRNLVFVSALQFPGGQPRQVRVTLRRVGTNWSFSLASQHPGGGALWEEHATGEIEAVVAEALRTRPITDVLGRCTVAQHTLAPGEIFTRQGRYLDFGPRWKVLRQVWLGRDEAVARLELPEGCVSDLETWVAHPALLDWATSFALPLIPGYASEDKLFVPLSYGRIRIQAPLPAKLYSHARLTTTAADSASFDVILLGEQGEELARVEDFVVRHISSEAVLAAPHPVAKPPHSSLLDTWLAGGIRPAEGVEALGRVLGSSVAGQVVVSSFDLAALRAQVDQPAASPASTAAPRSPAAGPKDEVEAFLAGLWRDLLGVEAGPHDDFFELGGQSLAAVRLFMKIKRTYKIELGLATLFEARTLGQLAALIRSEAGLDFAAPTTAVPSDRPAFTSLVPIQTGGSRPPLYLVHGVGGNVVGFAPLVRHLGADQPVYALQSQGLLSHSHPLLHTLAEMAAHYVEEIRRLQPTGPYYLIGYSLGGMITFEMAQQLTALGESVGLLGMFDTYQQSYPRTPHSPPWARDRLAGWARKLLFHSRHLLRGPDRFGPVRRRWTSLRFYLAYLWYQRTGRPLPHTLGLIEEVNRRAGLVYSPRPYPGRITLFRASRRSDDGVYDYTLGWKGLADVKVFDVPGNHMNMGDEPHVSVLAATLQQCLERARHGAALEQHATR